MANAPYLGCIVGRYALRIKDGAFTVDGQRYPGTVNVAVEYRLTQDSELKIRYTAHTDRTTPLSLTDSMHGEMRHFSVITVQVRTEDGADGGVSFPEPDVSNIGGITPWLKVAHLAEAYNRPVTTHGVHDLHVHILAAVPNASYLEAHGFGLEAYIAEPLKINDGWAIAPDRPGHGVEFDWEKLAAHRSGV